MAKTITYDEGQQGWTSFHSFIPDWMNRLNNRFFTVKGGQLYIHNDELNPVRNNFYGVQHASTLTYIINVDSSVIKVAKTINLESNKPFDVLIKSYINDETISVTQSTITAEEFFNKEGKWYAYTRRNELGGDVTAKNVYGLGRVDSVSTNVITFTAPISKALVSIGDILFSTALAPLGTITGYTDTTVTLSISPTLTPGDFLVGGKDGRIEGSAIRGYNFEVTLTDETNSRTELYAVSSELFKSEPS